MDQIAHIGIAVKNLEASVAVFRRLLGTEPSHREEVPDQRVRTAMFDIGGSAVELLEAMTADSPIARFIEKRGEGIHHLAVEVTDIHGELRRLKDEGVQLVDEQPRTGAGGCLVAFLHPKSTNGVLIELTQRPV